MPTLIAPRFAEMHGVDYQTLASWLKKRRQADPDHPALRSLVTAELDGVTQRSSTALPMELVLPCCVKLAIHTPSQIDLAEIQLEIRRCQLGNGARFQVSAVQFEATLLKTWPSLSSKCMRRIGTNARLLSHEAKPPQTFHPAKILSKNFVPQVILPPASTYFSRIS